jgi:hypothetical protein
MIDVGRADVEIPPRHRLSIASSNFHLFGHAVACHVLGSPAVSPAATAPVWLTYVSAAIALLAMLISLATYRRAGPRVWAKVYISTFPDDAPDNDLLVTLRLSNHGLAAQDVLGAHWGFSWSPVSVKAVQLHNEDISEGEQLPIRLDGRSTKTWVFSLRKTMKRLAASGDVRSLIKPSYKLHWYSFIPIMWHHKIIPAFAIAVDLGTNEIEARISLRSTYKLLRLLAAYDKAHANSLGAGTENKSLARLRTGEPDQQVDAEEHQSNKP